MTPAELLSALQSKFPDLQEIPKAPGQVRGDELYVAVSAAQLSRSAASSVSTRLSHLIFFPF